MLPSSPGHGTCDSKKIKSKLISPKKRQHEGNGDEKTPKRLKIGEPGPSRTTMTAQPRLPSTCELLVLPPMPMDMYNELTFSVDGLDSNDSATEPETDTDEVERRKLAYKKK